MQLGYRIFPVNPNETEVLGQKAYASLTDIPVAIDSHFAKVSSGEGIDRLLTPVRNIRAGGRKSAD